MEISVCDVPSNQNTLQLYVKNKPVSPVNYKQSKFNVMDETKLTELKQLLGLPDAASDEEIIKAVKMLIRDKGSQNTLKMCFKRGIISGEEYDALSKLSTDPIKTRQYLLQKEMAYEQNFDEEFSKFWRSEFFLLKIKQPADEMKFIREYAKQNFKMFKKFMSLVPKRPPLEEILPAESFNGKRCSRYSYGNNYNLSELRKNNPKLLRDNPDLYRQLVDEEKQKRQN